MRQTDKQDITDNGMIIGEKDPTEEFYLGLRLYPLTPLLNPDYIKAKTWNEVRGFFAPYVGLEVYSYSTNINLQGYGVLVGTVELGGNGNHSTYVLAAIGGVDIANLFYVEAVFRNAMIPMTIYDGGNSYGTDWKEDGVGFVGGIRFNF